MLCASLGLVCLLFGASLAQAQQSSSTLPEVGIQSHPNALTAIQHATIITEPGRVIEDGTIVIRDGKIMEVGSKLTPPAGADLIDLTGKTIYSGLIDAGLETELPVMELNRGANHWNPEVTPNRSVADSIVQDDAKMTKLRKAGITTVLLAPRDGIIKGKSAVVLTGNSPVPKSLLRRDVGMHVRLTVSRGRGRDAYPGSPMGAVALARQTFLDSQWYSQAWQAYRTQSGLEKPDANLAFDAMNDHLMAGKWVMFDALNEQYALRADDFGREFGLNVVLKGSGQEYQLLHKIAKLNRVIIVPVNFPKPPDVSTAEAVLDAELEELTHWELAPENPSRLVGSGVKIALTSSGLNEPSEFIPQIRKAIKRGLDKDKALEAVTTGPAKLLGIEDECGVIKSGAWANLLVCSGDLWDDKSKIEEVWVQGERPASASKVTKKVDGVWKMALSSPNGAESALPSELYLSLSDSEKKLSGGLALTKKSPVKPDETAKAKPEGEAPVVPAAPDAAVATAVPVAPAVPAAEEAKVASASEPAPEAPAPKTPASENPEKVEKSKEDKGSTKLKNPKWEDRTIAATFDAGKVLEGQKGTGYLTLALLPNGKSNAQEQLIGSVAWPDGKQQLIVAIQEPEEPKKEDSKEGKSADVKVADGKPEDNAVLSKLVYPVGSRGRESVPEQPEYVVFQNTTLWTCGPNGLLKDADLIVHKGIIQQIGTDLPVPAGAQVIDASAMQVSPGLIDCHSHMASDSGINEATQAITAEVRITDFIDASDITIYRQLAGGLTSANILHGSANPIGGQNQVIKLRWGATYDELKFQGAPQGIKFALGENVKQSNVQDSARTRYPQTRMGVEQIFRDRFNAALTYSQQWESWSKERKGLPPRRDLELEAIAEILKGERWVHCHSYRQDEILGLLRVLEDYHVRIGSLQHILEGYKVADAIAKHGATASSFSDWWNYKFEVLDSIPFNGAIMHQQGIVVSFNSDDAELGRHMNHEAAKAIKYGGVEPMEALKFVTLNPAKQLRIDSRVGSLEVGKDADISVWSGSPLSTLARCEQTWIDGRKYFDRNQDAEMRERDSQLHRSLVQKVLASGDSPGERSSLSDDPSRLWPHHDEYCHHHHDDHDDQQGHLGHEDHLEMQEQAHESEGHNHE